MHDYCVCVVCVCLSACIYYIGRMAVKHSLGTDSLNVFVSTEDPVALTMFKEHAPSEWNIYVYSAAVSKEQQVHEVRKDAIDNKGSSGRHALISLLLSMEANYFILTTGSNWSRLMDEIRRTILDHDCGGCTDMMDLQNGRQFGIPRPKKGFLRPENSFDLETDNTLSRIQTVSNNNNNKHTITTKEKESEDGEGVRVRNKEKINEVGIVTKEKVRQLFNQKHNRIPNCEYEFVKYTSCPLELKWELNIKEWQSDDVNICDFISEDEKNAWISTSLALQKDPSKMRVTTSSPEPPFEIWNYSMSVFTYKRIHGLASPSPSSSSSSSTSSSIVSESTSYLQRQQQHQLHHHKTDSSSDSIVIEYVHIPIEPTAAYLRDPRKCIDPMKETYTQSKDYLTPLSFEAALAHNSCELGHDVDSSDTPPQVFLFDAGATLPSVSTSKYNWSGTGWLFQWYQSRGIEFEHVFAWEPSKKGANFDGVPAELYPTLHYYPHGVVSEIGDKQNPLTIIKKLCRPKDIVIFKLDIDSPRIEQALMKQVLSDPELRNLVDEFYYEMHVCNNVMKLHALGCSKKDGETPFRVNEWYDVALPARRAGIRMHFWP